MITLKKILKLIKRKLIVKFNNYNYEKVNLFITKV